MRLAAGSRVVLLGLAVALVQGGLALALLGCPIFYGRQDPEKSLHDTRLFHHYAAEAVGGKVPYRDYRIEYPLLAFPWMLLPGLLTADLGRYRTLFACEVLLFNAAAVVMVARWVASKDGESRVAGRLAWYSAFLLVLCPVAVSRFDLIPASLAFAAAVAWASGWSRSGGVLTGFGILTKIFPGVVVFPGLFWDLGRSRKAAFTGVSAVVLTLVVGSLAWLGLGGTRVLDSLGYHVDRGLETGSTYAGWVALGQRIAGEPVEAGFRFGSGQLTSPIADRVAKLAFPLQALALMTVAWRCRKSALSDPIRWSAAAVVGFVVFGKVLSPQFLLWPLPFVAAIPGSTGRAARPLFLAACLATTAVFPWAADHVSTFDPPGLLLLNTRNGLLLALWAWLTFAPTRLIRTDPRVHIRPQVALAHSLDAAPEIMADASSGSRHGIT
jgi:hypothetical protein